MKAEDTVIGQKESDMIRCPACGADFVILYKRIREEQAEISFKVGKTLGVAESLMPATKAIEASRKAGYEEGVKKASYFLPSKAREIKQAGIREVVGEVNHLWKPSHHNLCYGVIDPHPDCICCKWQAKLKEWGMCPHLKTTIIDDRKYCVDCGVEL